MYEILKLFKIDERALLIKREKQTSNKSYCKEVMCPESDSPVGTSRRNTDEMRTNLEKQNYASLAIIDLN